MVGAGRFLVEPDSPEDRALLTPVLTRFLTVLKAEPPPPLLAGYRTTSMLAHELCNPLMTVRLAMQTILGQAQRDPIVQRARDVAQRQVKQLMRRLDDLMDVSRPTRGKIELRKESVTLQMIVAAALETTRGFIDTHLVKPARHEDLARLLGRVEPGSPR
jgi:signal transduction histidine kinase